MKKSIGIKLFGLILLLVIWQLGSLIIGKETLVLPGPLVVFVKGTELLGYAYTYRCILFSLIRTLWGFILSLLIAFILGVAAGNSSFLRNLFSPIMTTLKTLPTAALIFLFIVLHGATNAPIYVVMLVCIPILYEAVASGFAGVDSELIDACRIDGTDFWLENLYIRFPLALPAIKTGFVSSFSLSCKIELMAEVIAGSTAPGLGSALAAAQRIDPGNLVPVFAYSMIALVIFLIVDLLMSS